MDNYSEPGSDNYCKRVEFIDNSNTKVEQTFPIYDIQNQLHLKAFSVPNKIVITETYNSLPEMEVTWSMWEKFVPL